MQQQGYTKLPLMITPSWTRGRQITADKTALTRTIPGYTHAHVHTNMQAAGTVWKWVGKSRALWWQPLGSHVLFDDNRWEVTCSLTTTVGKSRALWTRAETHVHTQWFVCTYTNHHGHRHTPPQQYSATANETYLLSPSNKQSKLYNETKTHLITHACAQMRQEISKYNGRWEVTRYSNTPHGFTEWGSSSYKPWADGRSVCVCWCICVRFCP